MSSKRILGIAGAAMIGTLAGTGAVQATIYKETAGATGTVTGAVTFARETLRSDRKVTVDGKTYYEANAHTGNSGELDANVPIGVMVPANASNGAVVTVNLTNLVMSGIAPTLSFTNTADPPVAIAAVTTTVVAGGGEGDDFVQFSVTTGANAIPSSSRLFLEIGRIYVDPDNDGSISIRTSRVIAGERIESSTTLSNVVKVGSALIATATPTVQTASVEEMFMKFKTGTGVASDQLAANVGSLHIGIATTTGAFHNAGRGDVSSGMVSEASHLVSAAAVVFTGATSFLADEGEGDDAKKKVYVGDVDCTPIGSSIVDDDDASLKAALDPFDDYTGAVGSDERMASPGYLCLNVDGETVIPATEAYTASVTYTSALGANAAFLPPSSGILTLGRIIRDGSTVRIPYLTTNQKYNQRVVVVNHTSSPVEYSTTFKTADGTTSTARDAANGMLPAGRSVLNVRDMVRFDVEGNDNGGHGSAEMAVVAASNMIDVATVITTRSDGSTDTVVLTTQ